jgi:hypothetical protein
MGRRRVIFFLTQESTQNMQLSISGIKMMPNYQANVSKKPNAHAKLALFPNINQNKFPNECKKNFFV